MKKLLAGLIIVLFTLCAIALKILGIATIVAFILALIGLFDVQMNTAIHLLIATFVNGFVLVISLVIIKVLALK